MITPTDPWALKEAQKLIVCGCTFYEGFPPCKKCADVAHALATAWRRGIEEAAQHQEHIAGNPALRKGEADLIHALADEDAA